jgi:osmotically-inducible protein OsmY
MRHARRGATALALIAACMLAGVGTVGADAESDARVKQRIENKLLGLVSVHLEDLGLEVADGAVRLTGSVASVGERMTVERVLGGISGVTGLNNELTIRPTGRSEQALADEVRRLLQRRVRFQKSQVDVTASGSEVTLSGKIERAIDRLDAEDIAGSVTGVTRVVNNLQIVTQVQTPPEAIRERVLAVLKNPLTFGVIRNLEVTLEEGMVVLRGVVQREADRTQAERLTLGVTGVTGVKNLITVAGT